MTARERLAAHPLVIGTDQAHRGIVTAAVADAEAKITAALALWLQGHAEGLTDLLDASAAPVLAGIPVAAAFSAAREAVDAAVGDDRDRGMAAIMVLQERAAEYAAVANEYRARHADGNTR